MFLFVTFKSAPPTSSALIQTEQVAMAAHTQHRFQATVLLLHSSVRHRIWSLPPRIPTEIFLSGMCCCTEPSGPVAGLAKFSMGNRVAASTPLLVQMARLWP